MIKEKIPALRSLSNDEKLALAGELWDEVLEEQDIVLTKDQKKELDRRISYAEEHPEELVSWEKVKEDLENKYGI